MARSKARGKRKVWVRAVGWVLAIVLVVGAGYGLYRLISDNVKPAEKPGEEQTEQTPEQGNEEQTTPELALANQMLGA